MKLLKIKAFLLMAILTGFVFTACDETNDPITPTLDNPAAPTELLAVSIDATTIHLKWTASTDEGDELFDGYKLDVLLVNPDGSTSPSPIGSKDVAANDMPYALSDLQEGQIYQFELYAVYNDGAEIRFSETAATVRWAPAQRFEEINQQTIRVYASTSQDFGSGLDLYYNDDEAPRVWKVAFAEYWDLGLYTFDDKLIFGPAVDLPYTSFGGTPNVCEINDAFYYTGSLDNSFDKIALDQGTFSTLYFSLKDKTDNGDLIMDNVEQAGGVGFIVRVKDDNDEWHYSKVLVKYMNGSFIQDATGNNPYIEVSISYQMEADVPYAKTNSDKASKE